MCLKNTLHIRGSKLKGVEGAKTAAPFSVHTLWLCLQVMVSGLSSSIGSDAHGQNLICWHKLYFNDLANIWQGPRVLNLIVVQLPSISALRPQTLVNPWSGEGKSARKPSPDAYFIEPRHQWFCLFNFELEPILESMWFPLDFNPLVRLYSNHIAQFLNSRNCFSSISFIVETIIVAFGFCLAFGRFLTLFSWKKK